MQLRNGRLSLSPSDVTAFLACEHLTALQLRVARGELEVPEVRNEQAELVFRKGREHEQAYVAQLRAEGKTVREITLDGAFDWERAPAETVEAMRTGVDDVYQAVFVDGDWRGVADFLLRVDAPSELGCWSYEALDTKLARSAKPAYILQLCFYDEQLGRLQGRPPERIHVLLGSGEQQSFRPEEFGAYYRRVRARLVDFIATGDETEPYPNAHCGICAFEPICGEWWTSVDHLSRVAGIHRRQVDRLVAAGISTLAGLGTAPESPAPHGIAVETFAKIRRQAELQLSAREHGLDRYDLLEPQPGTGFALLPEPSPGDLFFDFEGNPFWDREGSLEYLWGILDADGRFKPLWAENHEQERDAFE